ncbi:MAG: hypothetical protein ACYTGQ_06700, partial [Planctomycetota bacterium]
MGVSAGTPLASAQNTPPTLDNQVLSNDNPDDTTRQAVEQFGSYWFGQLVAGADDQSVARGRRELVTVITGRGTAPAIVDILNTLLAPRLGEVMDSDSSVVKLNGLIVASVIPSPQIFDLSSKALTDSHWAVRYWGAKSVAEAVTVLTSPDPQQVQAVIDAMVAAAATEFSDATYAQYVATIGVLGQAGGRTGSV